MHLSDNLADFIFEGGDVPLESDDFAGCLLPVFVVLKLDAGVPLCERLLGDVVLSGNTCGRRILRCVFAACTGTAATF